METILIKKAPLDTPRNLTLVETLTLSWGTLGNTIVNLSNYIFILDLTPSMNWAETITRQDEKHLSVGIWCD